MRKSIATLAAVACILVGCNEDQAREEVSGHADGGIGFDGKRSVLADWHNSRIVDPATGVVPSNIRRKELAFAATHPVFNPFSEGRLPVDTWRNIGPDTLGGRTRALVADVLDETHMIAGGISGGIYATTDGGLSWTRRTTSIQSPGVTTIVQDTRPGFEHNWYAGTGELLGASAGGFAAFMHGDGMLKSTDNGMTWEPILSTTSGAPQSYNSAFDHIIRLALDPTSIGEPTLYAAVALGAIYRSEDGGNTWTEVLGRFGNDGGYTTDVAVANDGTVYAALSKRGINEITANTHGVYKSTDGINWEDITPEQWPGVFDRVVIGVSPADPDQVWFIMESEGFGQQGTAYRSGEPFELWHSLWKYDNAGEGFWVDKSSAIPKFGGLRGDFNSQGGYDLHVTCHPTDTNILVIGGTSLYISRDGFADMATLQWIGGYGSDYKRPLTMADLAYPDHHPDQHAALFLPSNPNVLYTASDGGIHRTNDVLADSVTWLERNKGYITSQFYTVRLHPRSDEHFQHFVVGGLQDNGSWLRLQQDGQDRWLSPMDADGAGCDIAIDGRTYYMSKQQGRVFKFELDSAGETLGWQRIDPIGPAVGDYEFINDLALDPNNNEVLYLPGQQRIWRNSELSSIVLNQTHDTIATGWDVIQGTEIDTAITSIAVSRIPAHVVYFGTQDGRVFRIDDAASVVAVVRDRTGDNLPSGYVSGIAIDPTDANHVIVCYSNYSLRSLFVTYDGGETWESIGGTLEQFASGSGNGPSVRDVKITYVNDQVYYVVGTSTGLYSTSFVAGETTVWTRIAEEHVGTLVVDAVDVRNGDNVIVAATHGGGVFEGPVPEWPTQTAPEIVAPENGDPDVVRGTMFSWLPGDQNVYWTLEIATDQEFENIVNTRYGLSDTLIQVTEIPESRIPLYARVIGYSSSGTDTSAAISFVSGLAAPRGQQPRNFDFSVSSPTEFVWTSVAGAEQYHLEVSSSPSFETKIVDEVLTDTMYSFVGLVANERYYWRASALDSDGRSNSSTRIFFGMAADVSVESNAALQTSITQSAGILHVTCESLASEPIVAQIYAVDGKLLGQKTIVARGGQERIELSTSRLSHGAYFLVISHNGLRTVHSFVK